VVVVVVVVVVMMVGLEVITSDIFRFFGTVDILVLFIIPLDDSDGCDGNNSVDKEGVETGAIGAAILEVTGCKGNNRGICAKRDALSGFRNPVQITFTTRIIGFADSEMGTDGRTRTAPSLRLITGIAGIAGVEGIKGIAGATVLSVGRTGIVGMVAAIATRPVVGGIGIVVVTVPICVCTDGPRWFWTTMAEAPTATAWMAVFAQKLELGLNAPVLPPLLLPSLSKLCLHHALIRFKLWARNCS